METRRLGALVLAGGQGRRMGGYSKALLTDARGMRFVDRLAVALQDFDEKLLSTADPSLAAGTCFCPVADLRPGSGPLAGLEAGLAACRSDGLLVVACDMPLFSAGLAAYLASFAGAGWPAWALRDRGGRLHPLCGVYTRACLPAIRAALDHGERRAGWLFGAVGGHALCLAGTRFDDSELYNVNTPQQLAALQAAGRL